MSHSVTARNILRHWIPLAIVTTFLSVVIYGTAQYILRTGGNDPQIQIAEDGARALGAGEPVSSVIAGRTVEISKSRAAFAALYDRAGQPLASSGLLHGQMPVMPPGVFDYVRQHGEERVTWQPEAGVRVASVVTRVDGANVGFVMAGRSLALVEQRIGEIALMTAAGWAGTLFVSLLAVTVLVWLFPE
ncbi:MAG: hypothetical protein ACM3U2_21425 [Deltaproteobacteria bacterium]